jgi:DNA-binding PadR family transcriptional regulator
MTPAVLHILLSLAAEDRHGLGIAADVNEFTNGRLEFGPGTLYGTIKRLLDAGMIEDLGQPSGGDDDPRRRYYRITPKGRKALAAETADMASVLTVAKRRRVLKTP